MTTSGQIRNTPADRKVSIPYKRGGCLRGPLYTLAVIVVIVVLVIILL